MPGIMSEGVNFENHQSSARRSQHRLWHRHRVSLGLNTSSALSRRNGSVL